MHTWLPDAHSQAPSGISAMLSGVVIEAGLVALLRVARCAGRCLWLMGRAAAGLRRAQYADGQSVALRQTQVKRLLAFSSLSHVGYMLLGLGIAFYAKEDGGAQGGIFHLLTTA